MLTSSFLLRLKNVKHALRILAVLQLTRYLWPQSAHIKNGQCFDYVVVGAGTAGAVVASRLSEDPDVSVLLIEAGGDPPIESDYPSLISYLKGTGSDWNYTTAYPEYSTKCSKKFLTNLMVGRILGGTSGLGFIHYGQGHYRDYNEWAEIVNDDTWRWENILPYFKKAERFRDRYVLNSPAGQYHGTAGPIGLERDNREHIQNYLQAFHEAKKPIKEDINIADSVGYTRDVHNIDDGHRQSSAFGYLTPNIDRPNLYVWKNAFVTKINFVGTTAVGVDVMKEVDKVDTLFEVRASKEVIISAGAINTPKLLMTSGIGPADHLQSHDIPLISDLPVGKNLQDHEGVVVVFNMTKVPQDPPIFSPFEFPAYTFRGSVSLNNSDYPDYLTWNYVNTPDGMMNYCADTYDFNNAVCDDMFATDTSTQMLFSVVYNLHPKSRGEVLLNNTFYKSQPLVYTSSNSHEKDLDDLVKYVQDFIKVKDTNVFKKFGAELKIPRLSKCDCMKKRDSEFWGCYASCMMLPQHDYCGTVAMGSVVNSRLLVYGVDKLRVVDASVIPIIPSYSLVGPVIAIAEKASDFIKQDNY